MKIIPTRRTLLATMPVGVTAFAGLLAFSAAAVAAPAAASASSAPASASSSAAPAAPAAAATSPAAASAPTTPSPSAGARTPKRAATSVSATKAKSSSAVPAAGPKAAAAAPDLHTSVSLSSVNGKATGSGGVVSAGDLLVYRVSVSNTGTAPGTVTLTETVPANTSYAATRTVWRGCGTAAKAGTTCTQQATLPAGNSGTTTFTVRAVDPLPGGVRSITDAVRASSGSCSACRATNATAARLHTTLRISSVNGHSASFATHLSRGDRVGYTISVYNNGGSTGTSTVHDSVPSHATFSGSGWSCAAGASAGSSCTRAVTVGAGSTVGASYRVTLTSYPGDTKTIVNAVSTSSGSCAACSVSNRTVANLVTTKEIFRVGTGLVGNSVDLRSGDRVVYRVTVTNTGGSTGRTTLADTVPANTSYVGQAQGWSCPRHSSSGTSCTQTVSVGSGSKLVLRYTVLIGSSTGAAFSSVTNSVTTSAGSCSSCTVTTSVSQEGALANTGIDTPAQSAVGVGLLGAGALLTLAGRRRRRTG